MQIRVNILQRKICFYFEKKESAASNLTPYGVDMDVDTLQVMLFLARDTPRTDHLFDLFPVHYLDFFKADIVPILYDLLLL